jgi:hypothetical protein
MKNIILFVLVNFVFIGYVNSQTRERYVLDNLEIPKDARVTAQSPFPPSPKINKKLVDKTTQTARIGNDLNLKNSSAANLKLVNKTIITSIGKELRGHTTGDPTIDSYIVDSSRRYNVDPLLIYSQMQQESGFKLKATSYKGARGLMQLMPATAVRFGVTDIYDPKQNIEGGVKYMRWLLNTFSGDLSLALAGYNAGEGAVIKYGYQIPPYSETQEYVRKISARYHSIKKIYSPKTFQNVSQQIVVKSEKQPTSSMSYGNSLKTDSPNRKMGPTDR